MLITEFGKAGSASKEIHLRLSEVSGLQNLFRLTRKVSVMCLFRGITAAELVRRVSVWAEQKRLR